MPLSLAPARLSLSRSSSLMSDGTNSNLGEPIHLLEQSDDSLFKSIDIFEDEVSMGDLHFEESDPALEWVPHQPVKSISKEPSNSSLPSSSSSFPGSVLIKSFSNSSQVVKPKDQEPTPVIPKVILNDTCGPLFQKSHSIPMCGMNSFKSKPMDSTKCDTSVLADTLQVSTSPSKALKIGNPLKKNGTSPALSAMSESNTKKLIAKAKQAMVKEEKPIKINHPSVTKPCLGILNGKQVASKVDSGLKSPPKHICSFSGTSIVSEGGFSPQKSLTNLKTQSISSSHIAFGSRYDLNANKNSNKTNLENKKGMSRNASNSIPELMVKPDWMKHPFTYSNKYATVPSKVKAYIEAKSTSSFNSTCFSTSISKSQSQSLKKSGSSGSTKSGDKLEKDNSSASTLPQKSSAKVAAHQKDVLLQHHTQIQECHHRDPMSLKLWSDLQTQFSKQLVEAEEMKCSYSSKPLTIALIKKAALMEYNKYLPPKTDSKLFKDMNEEMKTYTVKLVKFFPLFPCLTGSSKVIKPSSPTSPTSPTSANKMKNQLHLGKGSTQTLKKRTQTNVAVTSVNNPPSSLIKVTPSPQSTLFSSPIILSPHTPVAICVMTCDAFVQTEELVSTLAKIQDLFENPSGGFFMALALLYILIGLKFYIEVM